MNTKAAKRQRYTLGNNLKHYRELRNMTQAEMAALCRVTPNTYANFERKRRNPSALTMLLIAQALGTENKKTFWNIFFLEEHFN